MLRKTKNSFFSVFQGYAYPEDMAMPFFDRDFDYIAIEMHYDNANRRSTVVLPLIVSSLYFFRKSTLMIMVISRDAINKNSLK